MTTKDEQVRATIAEQASEWFVANDEAPLDSQESAALVTWLKASPLNVEEFLGVAAIARDLNAVGTDPELSVDALLACARAEEEVPVQSRWARAWTSVRDTPVLRWQATALAAATIGVASLGLLWWSLRPIAPVSARPDKPALHYETRHGEQQTYRLADNSILHLNTDSAVAVRYSGALRLVVLTSGEADFEVAHDPKRPFRVLAGRAEIVDIGTQFDVRLAGDSTVITVAAGRVAVEPTPGVGATASSQSPPPRSVELGANEQLRVAQGEWPARPLAVDAQRTTAWLHRQIVFDHEPLDRVAAEFNRYSSKPIEITAPALRDLEVSGVFSTDDADEFLAFLRSLDGVRVDVTATEIRVSQN